MRIFKVDIAGLQNYIPGFENAYLLESAKTLGVRESARMVGKYMLTGADVIECRRFDDAVAYGSYIIDIHIISHGISYEKNQGCRGCQRLKYLGSDAFEKVFGSNGYDRNRKTYLNPHRTRKTPFDFHRMFYV